MLKRLIGKIADGELFPGKMTYHEARASLEAHAHGARVFLAKRPDVEPEILYYLASDEAVEVRRLVAANPGAPQQANRLLAHDREDDVRCELARKLGRQFSDAGMTWTPRARALAFEVAEMLARDKVARVRAALADEMKSAVPMHVAEEHPRNATHSSLLQAS